MDNYSRYRNYYNYLVDNFSLKMETKTQKPHLIIVPEEDYAYGLLHGSYPEYKAELSSGKLMVLSPEDAQLCFGVPEPEENHIYVRNIFDGTYRDIASASIENDFIKAKAVALREALVMLGVYSANVTRNIHHTKESDIKANLNGKRAGLSGDIEYHQNKKQEIDIDAVIGLDPFPRKAENVEEIRKYINCHGLGNESSLVAWIDRLERGGKLEGGETIEFTFLDELQVARDAALNLKMVQAEVGFNIKSINKEKHEFTEKISVNWSAPSVINGHED